MFSDFVKFKEVLLLVDGKPEDQNGLVTLDISHDNEIYQLYFAFNSDEDNIANLTDYLNEQINKNVSVCIKVDYEIKKTGNTIVDLYRVIPESNKLLTVCKNKSSDIFVLKCRLIARDNIKFDYEAITKVVNF